MVADATQPLPAAPAIPVALPAGGAAEQAMTDDDDIAFPAETTEVESAGTGLTSSVSAASFTDADHLRLNFRGAPIELVLNYLSDAAGFIIHLNTPVQGKLDVWSNQPVTREEAIDLLNSVLNRNGYAAIRNGRTLTIMSRDEAIHGDIPVKVSEDPDSIPKTDEIMTVIIPVRFVEAVQLVKDLSSMTSPHTIIVANEAGNSVVITDTQATIRHLAEIIRAIDSSAEDVTEVRVFHLKHHDPTEVASLLMGLFSDQGGAGGTQAPLHFGGFGFGGNYGGGRGGQFRQGGGTVPVGVTASTQTDRAKKRQQVVAVADPRTSSVVVTAARNMIKQIGEMVAELDKESPGKVQHVSVIHLDNADPQQVQQVLQDMFQGSTSQRGSSSQLSPLQTRIQQNQGNTLSGSGVGNSGRMGSSMRSGSR